MSKQYVAGSREDYPQTLNERSDISAYLGSPLVDSCHTKQEFGTIAEAEAGCGLVVARDGVGIPFEDPDDPRATFIANGRNPIFVRTHFSDIYTDGIVTHTTLLSLRITTETTQPDRLCDNALIIKEQFVDGIEEIAVDSLSDPSEPYNPRTL